MSDRNLGRKRLLWSELREGTRKRCQRGEGKPDQTDPEGAGGCVGFVS